MRLRRVVGIGAALGAVPLGVYLWILYGQLREAFDRQDQFIPTRIYSDVTRIASPQTRGWIEEKLKNLGYSRDVTSEAGQNQIRFTLHPMDYPIYLIPDSHPTVEALNKSITLHFTGTEPDAPLQSIEMEGKEIADLYLEPELVATLSRTGETTQRIIREPLKFQEIPAPVWKAIIAIEDQHFLEHKGLDPRGIIRAIWVNLKTLSLAQGGSTITQQLVKNLMARRNKNLFRKANEILLAFLLEASFEKEQILERYLNEVYLGQVGSLEVHGVAEGAKHFFGKELSDLNLAEIALMAGLIRGPGYYSPYRHRDRAVERQQLVLKKMAETEQIAEEEAKAALSLPIRLAPPQNVANKAPYFTDFVKAELIRELKGKIPETEIAEAGFRVYTTLDLSMNQSAQLAVSRGLGALEQKLGLGKEGASVRIEGALASVDHTSGFIRALIGGRSYSFSTFNRILNMKRQVGSTFKPFVYLSALRKGMDPVGIAYGPGHPIEDAAWTLTHDGGRQQWSPKNYEKGYRGWINYRTALAHSVNTAAAKLGWEVGVPAIIDTARALGIQSPLPEVPSLSLGVAELSPIELLTAYATLANHGVRGDLTVIRAITQEDGTGYARFVTHPKPAIEQGPVDLLTDMLSSVFLEGTARGAIQMGFDRPAVGKTGTTSHHRDSWFAGYTPQLTTVVWVGLDTLEIPAADPKNAKNSKKKPREIQLTGGSSALPIWVEFMKKALEGEPPMTFPVSPHLVSLPIDIKTGEKALPGCPDEQVATEKYWKNFEPRMATCESMWPPSRATATSEQ